MTGNEELDAIIERLAKSKDGRLRLGDRGRLRYAVHLIKRGSAELQRASVLLAELIDELGPVRRHPTKRVEPPKPGENP